MNSHETVTQLYRRYVMPTYPPAALTLTRGRGARVWDSEGKAYLDFVAGIAVLNVGHSHPRVVAAIRAQAEQLVHVSNLYQNEPQARLAQRLAQKGLGGKCFFCNSGAEANEALIKLVRLWGHEQGRHEIVCMNGSFHGRTLATAAATGQAKVQQGFEPLPTGFRHAEFNDLDSVRGQINGRTAAILLEAVQGEGGVRPATPEFMRGVRALCDEHNLLMLCDEVQCGMGRTGSWFGYQASEAIPDAFSIAKSLGSGYPIGAIVSRPELADVFQPGRHASTFGGTPLACAAALATLDVLEEEKLVERAQTAGARFAERLRSLTERHAVVRSVRGRGLMLGLVLDRPVGELCGHLAGDGLLTLPAGEQVLRFLPPLNASDAELDQAVAIVDARLGQWKPAS